MIPLGGLQNNFKLTGFVSDEDLPVYYNVADLFALPSKSGEGLPLVALEAMACGLPVMATNVGGTSEVLNEKYGRLVPPNSPDSLAEAILDFSSKDVAALKKPLFFFFAFGHGFGKFGHEIESFFLETLLEYL